MKRYNCTLSDKRGAFGLCMEEHKEGMFVPFSEVEQLQAKLFELLEKFHRTGVAIERAISTGSVLADHPLKSRLELLANHHKREQELASQLSDATRQCGVLAGLLRDSIHCVRLAKENAMNMNSRDKHAVLLARIDAALSGKVIALLRKNPGLFSDNELADLHQLCDTELTKREKAIEEMMGSVLAVMNQSLQRRLCEDLYDAGYRKESK